jgi:NAD(P)-dependent dehydrogenase (short-subunit alcohol dehydrogenase family)
MKKVLITGGTGMLGRALVAAFARDYEVWFSYCNDKARADELLAKFPKAHAIHLSEKDISKVPNDIDILINNAALAIYQNPPDLPTDRQIRDCMEVNLILPFRLAKHMLPHMQKNKWGRIINISSIDGLKGTDYALAYDCSKFALNGMTRSMANVVGPFGITSNALCPALILDSELKDGQGIQCRADLAKPEEYKDWWADYNNVCPARRAANPAEIAAFALFLATDAAGYINGTTIPIDGGMLA